MTRRATTILNDAVGDLTLTWLEQDDAHVERIIQAAMDRGVQFFIIEPRMGGVHPPNRRPLTELAQARLYRALGVDEANAHALTHGDPVPAPSAEPDAPLNGEVLPPARSVDVVSTPDAPVRSKRKAKTAREAAGTETVAVKGRSGG